MFFSSYGDQTSFRSFIVQNKTGKLDILKTSIHILKEPLLSKTSIAFNQSSGRAFTEIPSHCPLLSMTKASCSAPRVRDLRQLCPDSFAALQPALKHHSICLSVRGQTHSAQLLLTFHRGWCSEPRRHLWPGILHGFPCFSLISGQAARQPRQLLCGDPWRTAL